MVKEIKIQTKDVYVKVDDDVFDKLSGYSWYLLNGKYPARHRTKSEVASGEPSVIYMHREIMGAIKSKETVDHINRDTMDNRRENLRLCSQRLNNLNKPPHSNNKCGYKGVRKKSGERSVPWEARIQLDGKRASLGHFDNPHDAARMYNFWAHDLFGEYAHLNVINE